LTIHATLFVIVSADRLRFMPSLIENVLGGVFLFLKQTMFYIAMMLITTGWELENTHFTMRIQPILNQTSKVLRIVS